MEAERMKRATYGLFGGLFALALVPVVVLLYLRFGNPPVAVRDKPFPFEAALVKIPRHARIERDEPQVCPLPRTDANLIAGAKIYVSDCASCHGYKNGNALYSRDMYPPAPNLWARHKKTVVGVSDDPVGETYWKVQNGIRLTGMPAFSTLLNDTHMWQVSMSLSGANQPLPAAADALVRAPQNTAQTSLETNQGSSEVAGRSRLR